MRLVLGCEAVPDVARRPPQIAGVLRPLPRLGGAPLAHREDDRAAALPERVRHHRIGFLRIAVAGAAPVVFQVIDAPAGISQRVLVFVALAPRAPAAGQAAGVGVDTELETARMDVVRQRLDTRREFLRVGGDEAISIARAVPAIVDDDILIAGVAHSARDHRVRRRPHRLLVDVAGELVPAVPAHRRS